MSDFTSRLPRSLYRAADVQRLDRIAIDQFGIDSFRLMQSAGAVTFNALLEQWPQTRHLKVFAGSGNNAGDGYIVAGLAQEQGINAEVIQVGAADKLTGDARKAWQWAQQRQVAMTPFSHFIAEESIGIGNAYSAAVLVDALFGTGLNREITGVYKDAVEYINASPCPVVAIDIPSGLNADSGAPLGSTVVADLTVTFIGMKQGLLTGRGRDFAGTIQFSDLDVPEEIYHSTSAPKISAQRVDINDATRHLLPRSCASHKGNHGHVVIIGGDYGFGGAAIMAAEAALRAGAGLVSLITRSTHRCAALARRPELMIVGTEDDSIALDELIARASVIAIGPGLGQGEWSRGLMRLALGVQRAKAIPLVVDADALHLLADSNLSGTMLKRDNWILTPHPGEAAILLGCSVAEIQHDRFSAISALNQKWGGSSLLKGSGSLICVGDRAQAPLYLSTEGNAGMATAGMGDVLSGICASLVAQGLSLTDSLICAVVIHGEAADLAMQEGGQRGMVATDLLHFIRALVNPAT